MELGIEDGGEVCYYLMGHSSGANICALAALQAATNCHKLAHNLVGFNGVYDIAKHFKFERERYLYAYVLIHTNTLAYFPSLDAKLCTYVYMHVCL